MFEKYRHLLSKSPIGPVPCLIPETTAMMRYMPPHCTHPRVIDVGCGQGAYTMQLRATGYDVTAIDLDNSQFPEALVADMHELPFPDNDFDIVFCTGTFEHAFAPYIVLSEFTRVLKNKGIILITLPMETNQKMLSLPEHFCSVSRFEMEQMYCTKLNLTLKNYTFDEWDQVVGPHQIFVLEVHKKK